MVLGRVVFLVIDAHHHGDVLFLGRGRYDDFFRAGVEVAFGLGGFGEKASALEDDVHDVFLPRKGRRTFFDREAFDLLTIDHEDVVLDRGGRGFLARDGAFEGTLGGVVFDEISEVVRRDEVVHRDHLEVFAQQPLLRDRAEDKASDAPETIDADFSHVFAVIFVFWMGSGGTDYLRIPAPEGQSTNNPPTPVRSLS